MPQTIQAPVQPSADALLLRLYVGDALSVEDKRHLVTWAGTPGDVREQLAQELLDGAGVLGLLEALRPVESRAWVRPLLTGSESWFCRQLAKRSDQEVDKILRFWDEESREWFWEQFTENLQRNHRGRGLMLNVKAHDAYSVRLPGEVWARCFDELQTDFWEWFRGADWEDRFKAKSLRLAGCTWRLGASEGGQGGYYVFRYAGHAFEDLGDVFDADYAAGLAVDCSCVDEIVYRHEELYDGPSQPRVEAWEPRFREELEELHYHEHIEASFSQLVNDLDTGIQKQEEMQRWVQDVEAAMRETAVDRFDIDSYDLAIDDVGRLDDEALEEAATYLGVEPEPAAVLAAVKALKVTPENIEDAFAALEAVFCKA